MATTAAPAAARGDNHDGASSSKQGRSFYRQRGDNISDSGASLLLRLIEISEPRIFQRAGLVLAKAQRHAVRRGDAGYRFTRLLGLRDHLADAWSARLAPLARGFGRRVQAIGRANADGPRLARGLYGRGVEAERRPSVSDRAGARLPAVEQQPIHLGHCGKVLASAAGRVREGKVAAVIAQNRPT